MIIDLNKDFLKEYKDDAWKGFSTKELLCLIAGVAVVVLIDVALVLNFNMNPATGIYIALPVAVPIMVWGFFKYQGFLSVSDLLREYFYHNDTSVLEYDSCETGREKAAFKIVHEQNRKKKKKKKNKLFSSPILYMRYHDYRRHLRARRNKDSDVYAVPTQLDVETDNTNAEKELNNERI